MHNMTRLWLPGLLLLALIGIPAAVDAAPAPPPAGATFQVLDLQAGGRVATTACGVFEQPVDGADWREIAGLHQKVIDIARLAGNELLAIGQVRDAPGNSGTTLFRRQPGGAWERLAQAPADPTTLTTNQAGTRVYLTTGYRPSQIWRSDDRGSSWQQIYQSQDVVLDVAVAGPFSGRQDMVVAVSRGEQDAPRTVVRSLDSGTTWKTVPGETAPTNSARLFVDYEGTRVYVASSGGSGMHLARVSDSSTQQETISLPEGWNGLPYGVNALAAFRSRIVLALNVPTNQATLIGAWRGTDLTYSTFAQGLQGGVWDLAFVQAPNEPALEPGLLAATDDGIYQRAASASSWTRLATQPRGCAETQTPPSSDPFAPVPRQQNSLDLIYFGETQHTLAHEFKGFWEQHGGLPIFGYPLSEEFPEHNADLNQVFTTQYLERERFEFHPENGAPYRVLLGRLGDELLKLQDRDWRTEDDLSNPFPNTACTGFDVGGERRQICGPFQQYWQEHGLNIDGQPGANDQESLALFGLPLTGVRMETNRAGDAVLTQWFERARFEWHPANPEPYQVLLGLLGNEIVERTR